MTERNRKPPKPRLDELLVQKGLAETRARAQALILAGRVLVDDQPVPKAGTRVAEDANLRVRGDQHRYVSRGGDKLEGALQDLGVDPQGAVVLDVGASTGGFTDCLLQHGAKRVIAVDVGTNQLALSLREDPRVRVFEQTNARHLEPKDFPEAIDLVTVDVSFISVRLLLEKIAEVAPRADLLILVKPQFEVGREQVGKGGVVRDDALREAALREVSEAAQTLGYTEMGHADSRLAGPKGNREIFLHLRRSRREARSA